MKGDDRIRMSKTNISYQNKDIVSKVFAEKFKGKSLSIYGINVPKVIDVLPTNLPDFSANEMKIDNLFLLEDGSVAIIDYESEYKKANRNKYFNYIARVLKRFENEGIFDVRLRMIVIYTGDVSREGVEDYHDVGALDLHVESAFLSEINSEEVRGRLEYKVKNNISLTDEEIMEFIILPLTYKGLEQKRKAAEEAVELVKQIKDEGVAMFVLSGVIVFGNKIIDDEIVKKARRWLRMTKLGQLIEDEKLEAVKAAVKEKDAEIAKISAEKDIEIAEKEARIQELEALLATK